MVATRVDRIEESYDLSTTYDAALIQGQDGFNAVLRSIVRRNLFPKVKFLNSGLELMYNEHSSSVCGSMLKWLGVQKNDHTCKYSIWSKNYKNIKSFHTQHRNNVIEKFQSIGKSKCIIVLLLSMNSY